MKTTRLFVISLIVAIVLQSCKNEKQIEISGVKTKMKYLQLEKAKWFMHSWENLSKESDFREIWTKKNDSTYSAKSFITVGKDTVFYEEVDLIERNDSLFYNVTVKEQKNDKPVSFYMTKANENEVVFENPEHDFPTKISYSRITNDSILAIISGVQNGIVKRESFPMKKSKK